MRLSDLATWSGGSLNGADQTVRQLTIDSRKVTAGDAFLALRGERFDGHDFLAQVAAAGAVGAVVEKPVSGFPGYVQVDDSRRALGLIAKGWCDQFGLRRVAVTGNAGKTSVKEMIACLLGEDTLFTAGNLNNDIGVPLTLLRADASHRYGVFELGASHAGEIAWTASLVRPEVVLVTNVTGAHLGGFGSMQGIANAKAEIFAAAAPGARAIINRDDGFADFFTAQAQAAGLHIISVGSQGAADFSASGWREDAQGSHFVLHHQGNSQPVMLSLPGRHQLANALQAIAAVAALGLDVSERLHRLATLQPVAGRMVRHPLDKGLLVDDSYNANPGSVLAAGRWLATQPRPQLFVLGGVAELGEQEVALHQQMGRDLAALHIDRLLTVGERARPAAAAFGPGASALATHDDALPQARDVLAAGGSVLVKGSRSAAMEQLVKALLAEQRGNDRLIEETH